MTNDATAVLNIGGLTTTITTLNATTAGNTVNYTGAAQAGKPTTYHHLTLSGSGIKTFSTTPTVNGILSMEGTASVIATSGRVTYGPNATLQYNKPAAYTATTEEWLATFAATGGVVIANTGAITIGANKVLNANVPLSINLGASLTTGASTLSVGGATTIAGTITLANTATKTFTGDVTINSGGVWNETGAASIGFVGNLQNDGTFTSNTGTHTFSGTSKTLSGISAISIPTATFTGTYTNSGTFSVATLLTVTGVTLTNNGTITATTALSGTGGTLLQGTTGILNLAGTSGITTLTATAVGNIVNYTGGAQTAKVTTYDNLTLSGSLSKTFATTPTVNGILSLEGTATVTVTGTAVVTYGSGATLQYKGSAAQTTTNEEFPATWVASGGIKIENANGVTMNAIKDIGANPFSIGSSVTNSIFNDGGFKLIGTGTFNLANGGTYKCLNTTAPIFPDFSTINPTSGTVEYAAAATQTIKGCSYNNLTISGAGSNSKIADGNISVSGVLNLNSANFSASQGCLSMSTFTLTMGASATTTGTGDVNGIVTRNSFVTATPYSFGNQFTTIRLASGGTLPSTMSVKIVLANPSISGLTSIKRYYDIIQTGGSSSTKVTLNLHYLDGELNGATETDLSEFDYHVGVRTDDHGHSVNNSTDNWVGLGNLAVTYVGSSSSFGSKYWTLGTSTAGSDHVWIAASNSSDWLDGGNWQGGAPDGISFSTDHVTIRATINGKYPTLPSSTTIGFLTIEAGATLDGGSGTSLTITGAAGAWENLGTFNAGTSTIIFTNAAATIAHTTDFYNITTNTGATLNMATGTIMRIAGTLTNNGVLSTVSGGSSSTVEYNGGAQTVVVPDASTYRYYNLILSGSGVKTLPSSALSILGSFTIGGTASVSGAAALTVTGDFSIGSGSSFTSGAYSHSVGGNFANSGTFTGTIGSTFTFNGTSADTIGGSSTSTFYNLTINNSSSALLTANATINNTLTLSSGNLAVGAKTLAINGTVSKTAGCYVDASASSGTVLYSGTNGAQSIASGTFLNNEVNNLTINNSSNVTLNGTLRLLNALLVSSGKLDAVTYSPTLVYGGSSSQTIATGQFLNNSIYNLTSDNTAGLTLTSSAITTVPGTLTINSGKVFNIGSTSMLTAGTISNSGGESGLVIKSDGSGTGSLIESSTGVAATVQRYIPTGSQYHFVSSPMTNGLSGAFRYAWMYSWNELTQYWDNIVSAQLALTPMKGFSVRLSNGTVPGTPNNPVLFTGNLNTGAQSINLSFTNAGGAEGFNLVGNPYPSYIDWDANGWTKTNLDDAIYFWDGSQYTYYVNKSGTLGGSRYIAPGQGFFVHVSTAGTGTLGVSNTVKTHTAVVFRAANDNSLRLKIENDSMKDEVIIRFNPDATANFDGSLDAYKRFGNINFPQLYTNTADGNYASINSLPEANIDSTKVIMNVQIGVSGNYKITASDIETFKAGAYIALEDTKTNTTQILSENPVYSFYADTSNQTGRFIVWFYNKTNSVSELSNREPSIISKGNTLFVDLNGMGNTGELIVSNMLGQSVYQGQIKSNKQTSFVTNLSSGVYVVRLLVGGKWYDRKMMW